MNITCHIATCITLQVSYDPFLSSHLMSFTMVELVLTYNSTMNIYMVFYTSLHTYYTANNIYMEIIFHFECSFYRRKMLLLQKIHTKFAYKMM